MKGEMDDGRSGGEVLVTMAMNDLMPLIVLTLLVLSDTHVIVACLVDIITSNLRDNHILY
jgi:Tfp pilus assembly protein PilX